MSPQQQQPAILPTVGRVVLYRPNLSDPQDQAIVTAGSEPLAAIVCRVWGPGTVNLCLFDANGHTHSRTSVQLVQAHEPKPSGRYCEWMPYQLGQAARHAAAEAPALAGSAS